MASGHLQPPRFAAHFVYFPDLHLSLGTHRWQPHAKPPTRWRPGEGNSASSPLRTPACSEEQGPEETMSYCSLGVLWADTRGVGSCPLAPHPSEPRIVQFARAPRDVRSTRFPFNKFRSFGAQARAARECRCELRHWACTVASWDLLAGIRRKLLLWGYSAERESPCGTSGPPRPRKSESCRQLATSSHPDTTRLSDVSASVSSIFVFFRESRCRNPSVALLKARVGSAGRRQTDDRSSDEHRLSDGRQPTTTDDR